MNAFEMVEDIGFFIKIRLDYREGSSLGPAIRVDRGLRVMECDNKVSRKVILRVHLPKARRRIYNLDISHGVNHYGDYQQVVANCMK